MDDKDMKDGESPVILIRERRTRREGELSSAEIMRILRKRAAGKSLRDGSDDSGSHSAG